MSFKRLRSFRFPNSEVLFRLLRTEDLQQLKKHKIDFAGFSDAIKFLFNGGHYSEIREQRNWNRFKDTPVEVPHHSNGEHESRTTFLTWEEQVNLCDTFQNGGVIGNAPDMVALYSEVNRICKSIMQNPDRLPNILLYGSPGTGKELIADTIRTLSGRSKGIFRKINCGALPSELAESELFGYKKGAFTGALVDKKGLLDVGEEGVVQLDEIDKMRLSHQGLLLRVLQEREFTPLGEREPRPLKGVLFISSCNRNLAQMVNRRKFLGDLLGRLSGRVLTIPSLKDRPSDIPLVINHHLKKNHLGNLLNEFRFPFSLWGMGRMFLWEENNVRELLKVIDQQAERLNPDVGPDTPNDPKIEATLAKPKEVIGKIETGVLKPLSIEEFAHEAGVSRSNIYANLILKRFVETQTQKGNIKKYGRKSAT